MTKISALLIALALVALSGPIAVADGGGRDVISPFKLDDPEAPDHEREGDPEFRSMLRRGAEGEFGKIAVMVATDRDFAAAFTEGLALIVQGYGGGAPESKNPLKALSGLFSGKGEIKVGLRFGSAYFYQEDVFIFPDASEIAPGDFNIDFTRKFFITEKYEDEDPWTLTLPPGSFQPQPIVEEARLTYKSVIDEGAKFGDVYYDTNRFTILGDKEVVSEF